MVSIRILAKSLVKRLLLSGFVESVMNFIEFYNTHRHLGPYSLSDVVETYRRIDDEVRLRALPEGDYRFQQLFWTSYAGVLKERKSERGSSAEAA